MCASFPKKEKNITMNINYSHRLKLIGNFIFFSGSFNLIIPFPYQSQSERIEIRETSNIGPSNSKELKSWPHFDIAMFEICGIDSQKWPARGKLNPTHFSINTCISYMMKKNKALSKI